MTAARMPFLKLIFFSNDIRYEFKQYPKMGFYSQQGNNNSSTIMTNSEGRGQSS